MPLVLIQEVIFLSTKLLFTAVFVIVLLMATLHSPFVIAMELHRSAQCPQKSLCEQDSITELLQKINQHRSVGPGCFSGHYKGAGSLSLNKRLKKAASKHALDMAKNSFLKHYSQKTGSYQVRVDKAGYKWIAVAENIAAGQRSVDDVLQAWLESKQHCDLMLSPDYQEAGLACAINCNDKYGIYWALVLASPK